ncbi:MULTISPECIES: hypothetical protein [unclassified Pseudomonas]|uniref:hypothetical protein n=1 Tax=unclassified Pseudomonas TaxID=196821 RepID=UPI001EE34517|nr:MULTISPECIES: hypothetical protein [unclassified Pseudomonas]
MNSNEMKFRTLDGASVTLNPTAELVEPLTLDDPEREPGTGQLETGNLLRKDVEKLIREFSGEPAKAALAICVMLDDHLDLAENGWFDNDEVVQDAIIAADPQDD